MLTPPLHRGSSTRDSHRFTEHPVVGGSVSCLLILLLCFFICVCVCVHLCACRSQRTALGCVCWGYLFFPSIIWVLRQTQKVRFSGKHLLPQSHLISLAFCFLSVGSAEKVTQSAAAADVRRTWWWAVLLAKKNRHVVHVYHRAHPIQLPMPLQILAMRIALLSHPASLNFLL